MRRPLVFALVLALSATGAWADRYSDCDQAASPIDQHTLTLKSCAVSSLSAQVSSRSAETGLREATS